MRGNLMSRNFTPLPSHVQNKLQDYRNSLNMVRVRPGSDQSSKAAICKSAFAKSKLTFGKSAFSRSRFAFRQSIFASQKAMVWPSATSKMLSPETSQNVLDSNFCFLLDWCVPCRNFNKRMHVLAKALLPKVNLLLAKVLLQIAALLDWSAPGLSRVFRAYCVYLFS